MRLRNISALAVSLILVLGGCTRGQGKSSDVELSFASSDIGSLASELGVVIVNVSAPDMKTYLYQWDRHSCGNAPVCNIPSEIRMTVPSGAGRVIQVLAVYKQDNGAMEFRYDDTVRNLEPGDVPVDLSPKPIGSATAEAHIYGRYLDNATSGPTGTLETRFNPGNGRPSLTIQNSYIYNGWFTAFTLNGSASFDYYVNGAPKIMSLNMDSALLNPGAARVLRVDIPRFEREQMDESGNPTYESEGAQKIFTGFFGPGASGQQACYDNTSEVDIQGASLPGTTGGTPLKWRGTASSGGAAYAWPESGGYGFDPAAVGDSCNVAANDYVNNIVFHHAGLRNGHDSTVGIRGPFRSLSRLQTMFSKLTTVAAGFKIDWMYLPGVGNPGVLKGARLFVRPRPANGGDNELYGMGDGIDCGRLGSLGFSVAGADVPATSDTATATIALAGNPQPENYQIIICPIAKDGSLIPVGMKVESYGGGDTPSFKLTGSNTTKSGFWGPSLQGPATILKSAFSNGFHMLLPALGGNILLASEVDHAEVSIDGGTTYSALSSSSFNMNSTAYWAPGALGLGSTAADVDLKVRVYLTPTAAASRLPEGVFESPTLHLLGNATCPAPGSIEAMDAGTGTTIANVLTGITNSDMSQNFKMRYSGCPSALAMLDYIDITGSTSPTGCFGQGQDIYRDQTDPFLVHISPSDSTGMDCSLSGLSVKFAAPSNAGNDGIAISPGNTILHSTVTTGLAFIASTTVQSVINKYRYVYDLVMFGPSQSFKAQPVNMNSDGRFVDTGTSAGLASASTTYAMDITGWLTSLSSGQLFDVTSLSNTVASPARTMVATDGAVSGSLPMNVSPLGWAVQAVSEQDFRGGSPILVKNDGTNLTLAYIPGTNDNYAGKSLTAINSPAISAADVMYAKVFSLRANGMEGIFLVVGRSTAAEFYYGQAQFNGSISWAPAYNHAVQVNAAAVISDSGVLKPMFAYNGGTNRLLTFGSFPTFNGSTWSDDAVSSGSLSEVTLSGMQSVIGIGRCGNLQVVGGRDASNNFMYTEISPGAIGNSGISTVPASGAKQFSCMSLGSNGGAKLFSLFDPSGSFTTVEAGFESDSGTDCGGGTARQSLTINNSYSASIAPAGGTGHLAIFPLKGMGIDKLLYVYQPASGGIVLQAGNVACTGGNVNLTTAIDIFGQIQTTHSSLRGVQELRSGNDGSPARGMSVFGNDGQLYILRSR